MLDIFRCEGGSCHDFALHGATLFDQTLEAVSGLEMSAMEGEMPLLEECDAPWHEPLGSRRDQASMYTEHAVYGLFRNVQQCTPREGEWSVLFKTSGEGGKDHGPAGGSLCVWGAEAPGAGSTVMMAQSPFRSRKLGARGWNAPKGRI